MRKISWFEIFTRKNLNSCRKDLGRATLTCSNILYAFQFCDFNIRSSYQLRKYFYNEVFQIYDNLFLVYKLKLIIIVS